MLPAARLQGLALTIACGLVASIPVIIATVEGLREGAIATGDRAIILTRAYDVFSSHTPLVGQYSASSLLYDHVVHSLGPLSYWLLAVPVRIDAAVAPALAVALMNVLAILAAVVLARRRGGIPMMIVSALAITLMCNSIAPETFHDAWNPSVGLLPLMALIFVGWSLACGERRLLPLGVLLASFAAQSELVFLVPSVGVLALGMLGLALEAPGRARAWRWWLAALATGLACWSAPIVDGLQGKPGNLTLVAEAAFSHGHTVGYGAGWRAVVRAVGITPWWLTHVKDPFGRLADIHGTPGTLALASCLALLAALAVALAAGARRARADVAWGCAIALVLCFSLVGITASMSARPSLEKSLGYMLWIGSPIGMWAWLMLTFSAGVLLAPLLRRALARAQLARAWRPSLALGGLTLTLAVAGTVAAGQGPDQDRAEYRPVKIVQQAVRAALGPTPRSVLVTGAHTFTAFDFRAAVVYELRRSGWRVYDPAASVRLGSYYRPPKGASLTTVWIFDEAHPRKYGRVIERLSFGAPAKTITVELSAPRGGGGSH